MSDQREVDEFGIPIKKAPESKKQEFDEFGIPIKKKEPTGDVSATGTEPTSPSKSPLPYTEVKKKTKEYDDNITSVKNDFDSKYANIEEELRVLNQNYEKAYSGLQELVNKGEKTPEEANIELSNLYNQIGNLYKNYEADYKKYNSVVSQRNQFVKANPVIDVQKFAAGGGKTPTTQVDLDVEKKRQELPYKIPQRGIGLTPPTGETQVETPEFVQEQEMPAFTSFEEAKEDLSQIQEKTMTTKELSRMRGYGISENSDVPKFIKVPNQGGEVPNEEYYSSVANDYEKAAYEALYKSEFAAPPREGEDFNLASPKDLFREYEGIVVDYLTDLDRTSPDNYKNILRKIRDGQMRQKDMLDLIYRAEGFAAKNLIRDVEVLKGRIDAGQEDLIPEFNQKVGELNAMQGNQEYIVSKFPVIAQEIWAQKVMQRRYDETSGMSGIVPSIYTAGAQVNNMVIKTVSSTGAWLGRLVGSEYAADAWGNFWDGGLVQSPEAPVIVDGQIDWSNAMVNVLPQLIQMELLFNRGAGAVNKAAGVGVKSPIGLVTTGFFSSYKDLYDQAKAANLSDYEANVYANVVGMGVAMTELIMPDRNFFAAQKDDYLRFMIKETAKGSSRKNATKALVEYIKNVAKEEVEELTSEIVTSASAVIADANIDGANFDQQLFDKDGIINTVVITALTAGLAGVGSLTQDLTKRNRDIYQLAKNYEQFKEQSASLVEDGVITPEQATKLTEQVDRVVAAESKVPKTMPEKKKANVVPLVAEKDELEAQKKELDPIFQPPIDKKIQEVEEEILAIYEQKAEMESPTIKPEVVDEQGEEVKPQEEGVVQPQEEVEPLKSVEATSKSLELEDNLDADLDGFYEQFSESPNKEVKALANLIDNVQEAKERKSILNIPLEEVESAVDGVLKKENPFLEKKEGREAKQVAKKYLGDVSKKEAIADFKDAFFGNPDTWVADSLKMRESVRVYIENGGTFKELLGSVQKEFDSDGFTETEAAAVIKEKINALNKKDFRQQQISEAYHKAKKDGSNPELVQAVEDLLTPQAEVVGQKESPSVQAEEKVVDPEVSEKREAKAKEFGYANAFQAVNSVNKNLDKEYTIEDFDNIPDAEFKEAASKSKSVERNKAKEEKVKAIEAKRAEIFKRIADKTKGKLTSGIDPSIIPDLIELGATYVEEGIVKASDFIARMREDLRALGIDDTEVTDEQITSEIFENVAPKEEKPVTKKDDSGKKAVSDGWASENVKQPPKPKTKEAGRSKTIREGRFAFAPQELVDEVKNNPITYKQFSVEQALESVKDFLGNYGGITLDNFYEVAIDIISVLKDAPLDNQWSALAANIVGAKGVEMAKSLQEEGDVEGAKKLMDASMDLINEVTEIQTRAGQLNGLTAALYYITPEGMTMYLTRMVERGIVVSKVVSKRKKNADRSAEVIKKAVEQVQKKAARKVSEGVKSGNVASDVKTKSKGTNPRAYKPDLKRANDLIKQGFALIQKSRGSMTSGGLSPDLVEGVAKVIEGYLIKGTTNLKYLYSKVRNAVIDIAETDLTREDFEQIIKDYGLEEVRLEVERKKIEGDDFLKTKIKEQIKAQDILAELVYEHYSGEGKRIDDVSSAIAQELGLTNEQAENVKQRIDKVFEATLEEENKKLLRRKFRGKRGASRQKTDDAAKNISELVLAGALDNKYIADQLAEIYGIPSLTPEDIMELKDLSNKFFQADLYKDEIAKKIASFVVDKLPPDAFAIFKGMWYASILSGAGTQITNIIGNLSVLVPEINVEKLAAIYGAKNKGAYMSLPDKQSAKRFVKATQRANEMFLEVIKNGATYNKYTEENLTKFKSEFSVENIDKLRMSNKYLDQTIGAATRKTYTPVKYMVRALEAADQGFGSFAFDAKASIALKAAFIEQGLRGKELQNALTESLFGTKEIVEEAKAKAIEELSELGLDPNDALKVKKGVTDFIRKRLDADVRADANKFATRVTFKGKPSGMFGVIADFISKSHSFPVIGVFTRFIVPFVNVPFNMASMYSDWIPFYGLARAYGVSPSGILDRVNPQILKGIGVKSPKAVTPQDLQVAWVRTIVGSLWSSSIIALTFMKYIDDDGEEKPILEISGTRAYLDFKKRQDVERDMPEMSIRFMGGTPFSYKLLPIAPTLLIRGEFMDRDKYDEGREYERSFLDRTLLAAKTMALFFVDATPMDGLKKLNESIDEASNKKTDEGEVFSKAMETWVVKNVVNIAEPNLYRQFLNIYDPTSYSPEDISEMLFKSVNLGFLDEDMGYYFDGFGRKIKYYPSEKYFPIQHILGMKGKDPVDKVLLDKGIYVSDYIAPFKVMSFTTSKSGVTWMRSKKFREEYAEELEEMGLLKANPNDLKKAEALIERNIEVEFITQKEWQKMCVEVGQRAYKQVEKELSDIKKMPPEEAKERVKEIFDEEYDNYTDENFIHE